MKIFVVLALCAVAGGSPRLDGRIVGGRDFDISEVPYQLSLRKYEYPVCGASIISEYWALSAAHCFENTQDPDAISFRAGSSSKAEGGTLHWAEEFIIHPNYDPDTTDFDFALIKVKNPFPIGSKAVQTVKLADEEPLGGTVCVSSGWGSTDGVSNGPLELQGVELPIIDRKDCEAAYRLYPPYTENMICAGFLGVGGKDSCQGDSGGPLVSNGVQVGVVSWGIGCADPTFPGIYSNVAKQRAWIRTVSSV